MIVSTARRFAARGVYVVLLAALLLAVPAVAQAKFVRTATASTAVSTDTLTAPASATASKQCVFLNAYNAQVSWSVAADQYATGYVVTRIAANGATATTTVSGRSTTSATIGVGFGASYTFTVTTTYRSWSSAPSAPTAAVQCGLFG